MTSSRALLSIVLLLSAVQELAGQRSRFGVGVNSGTIPRALEPLCASARRLRGVGLTASGGTSVAAFRIGATLDYVNRVGVRDAADCVPRIGTSVDSTFAAAGNSAASLSLNAWAPAIGILSVGAEGGWVVNNASWFIGPALGLQVWRFRTEVAVRRHTTKYEEITRVFESPNVRELSRISRAEKGWGAVARVLLMVF